MARIATSRIFNMSEHEGNQHHKVRRLLQAEDLEPEAQPLQLECLLDNWMLERLVVICHTVKSNSAVRSTHQG